MRSLKTGLNFPAADRYLGLIYPKPGTALDYLPEDALIVVIDHGRVGERSKNYSWQLEQDVETMLENGTLHPSIAKFALSLGEMFEGLSNRPMVYLDTFIGSSYELPPKALISFTAKQAAVPTEGVLKPPIEDTRHYVNAGSATVLLAANELRAKQLFELLQENGIKSLLDLKLTSLPPRAAVPLLLAASAAASISELRSRGNHRGTAGCPNKKENAQTFAARKDQLLYRPYPGDIVVHEHHGIARFSGL